MGMIDRDDAIQAICEACYMYKYVGEHHKDCKYYPCDDIKALEAIPSAEQVTSKLQNPCDSLLTEESNGSKEQKSKLDLVSRADAIEATWKEPAYTDAINVLTEVRERIKALPSAEAVQGWIPCSERLPKINQEVLLSTADGKVFVGHREKPDLVWQVTETDGRKHWVYDPEAYTDDVDGLPKAEDCGFDKDSPYSDGLLSVTSVNYDNRFDGVTAWMPLPKPYTKGDNDEER